MQLSALKGLYIFAELLFQRLYVVHFLSCFGCLLYTIVSVTSRTQVHKKAIYFAGQT